jgi:hypothetical protein
MYALCEPGGWCQGKLERAPSGVNTLVLSGVSLHSEE